MSFLHDSTPGLNGQNSPEVSVKAPKVNPDLLTEKECDQIITLLTSNDPDLAIKMAYTWGTLIALLEINGHCLPDGVIFQNLRPQQVQLSQADASNGQNAPSVKAPVVTTKRVSRIKQDKENGETDYSSDYDIDVIVVNVKNGEMDDRQGLSCLMVCPELALHVTKDDVWSLIHVPTGSFFAKSKRWFDLERLAWDLIDLGLSLNFQVVGADGKVTPEAISLRNYLGSLQSTGADLKDFSYPSDYVLPEPFTFNPQGLE